MATISQRSFSAGEISPSLYARVDTVKYATGLRTCRNFLVMRHGGAANRPGTTFVGEVADSSATVRLIPFVFNTDQTYVLEFGDSYMRVNRNGGQVLESTVAITDITSANPGVVTANSHGYTDGDEVYISGVVGMTEVNGRNFKINNSTTHTFELQLMDGATNFDTSALTAYASGGTCARVYEIASPYAEADLSELQYVQSADVITISHPTYAPRQLSRSGHTSWSFATITFAPSIAAPTSPANTGAAGTGTGWVITAIASETYEESLPSAATTTSATVTSSAPVTVTWATVSGAHEYNVYKSTGGSVYGYIGTATAGTFTDNGINEDTEDTPPTARNPFSGADDYPSTVTYIQQRLAFGSTNNDPEKAWTSRTGQFTNFTVSSPLQDDDAVTFSFAGRQVNRVKHLLDLGQLVCLTSGGEWAIQGDAAGTLKPGDINPKQYSYNGSSSLSPLIIGGNALYVQARGSIIRDLAFDYQVDGYRGNDLTIFSAHLTDGYTLSDWAYQQVPHSVVWAARSDGTLLGLTYVREHEVLGWHRHDFGGTVENVCVVPEGDEDRLYLVIKRTIDAKTVRYIERMETRRVDDIVDSVFVDCSLTYDGRNTNTSHTMTLSGGTNWTYDETITLTSSASYFSATEVGNQIHLVGSDGTNIRFSIETYSSGTVVTGKPNRTVPAAMRSTAISDWSRAVDQVTGLWHLEGEDVAVTADGFVVASPNNASYTIRTITEGVLTLDKAYGVIHVGLPYISDIETLNVDVSQGETLSDKKKKVDRLTIHLEKSRGIFAGSEPPSDDAVDPLENLVELKIRNEEGYDDPVALKTGTVDINIQPQWNSNGRIFIRQVDPLPATVLAVAEAGSFPIRGG